MTDHATVYDVQDFLSVADLRKETHLARADEATVQDGPVNTPTDKD